MPLCHGREKNGLKMWLCAIFREREKNGLGFQGKGKKWAGFSGKGKENGLKMLLHDIFREKKKKGV